MVIFITSKSAYIEMENLIMSGENPVWLSSGILDSCKIEEIQNKDIDLSVFNYEIDTSNREDLECALSTIREHHYDENIWVQFQNEKIKT